jgi:hypothetical protein
MPKYKITNNKTGQSLIVSGNEPPSQETINSIFSQYQKPDATNTSQQKTQPSLGQEISGDIESSQKNYVSKMATADSLMGTGNVGDYISGAMQGINAKFSQAAPFLTTPERAIRKLPAGNMAMDVAGAIPYVLGQVGDIAGSSAAQMTGASPKTTQIAGEFGGNVLPMVLPEIMNKIPNTAEGIRSLTQKITPTPERVYSVAGKLGGLGVEADAANYGVKNRVKIGGSYDFQPKNYEENQSKIKDLIENKLTPEIDATQATGAWIDRGIVMQQVNDYLKKTFDPLKTPTGRVRYQKILQSLNDEFAQGNQKITPSEMQEAKTATHQTANYDAEGQITDAYNKAVAHIYRNQLEQWNPNLRGINKELLNLDILGQSIYNEGMRSSKSMPKGESGLPFYIAISNPLKGGMVSGARQIMSAASPLSKTAFAIDKMRNFGLVQPDITSMRQPLNISTQDFPPARQPIGLLPKPPIVTPPPADISGLRSWQVPSTQYGANNPYPAPQLPPAQTRIFPEYQSPSRGFPNSAPQMADQLQVQRGKFPPRSYDINYAEEPPPYNGMKDMGNGTSLPMYTDMKTTSTFILSPGENMEQALARIRGTFK